MVGKVFLRHPHPQPLLFNHATFGGCADENIVYPYLTLGKHP